MLITRFLCLVLFGMGLGVFLGYLNIFWDSWKYWMIAIPAILLFIVLLNILKVRGREGSEKKKETT